MAGGLTVEDVKLIRTMAVDIALIKETIEPLPDMYKDIYIGNGDPPLRTTCRAYEAERKAKSQANTEAVKEKKDDQKWFKRLVIGGFVAQSIIMAFSWLK